MTPFDAEAVVNAAHEAFGEPKLDPEWPEPDLSMVRSQMLPAPQWPAGVLPPFWERWTKEAAETAGAPWSFAAISTLAAGGALLGNARCGSPWQHWSHPSNLWVCLVGRPSSGKSGVIKRLQKLLSRIEQDLNEDHVERKRQYEQAKAIAKVERDKYNERAKKAVQDGDTPPDMPVAAMTPEEPARRRVYSTNTTIEKAALLSAANERGLLLLSDELSFVFGSMDRYGGKSVGADRAFWLQTYEGMAYTSDRVKDGNNEVSIHNLTWGKLGGIQPDRLASLVLSGDDDGLAARFLYDWPSAVPPRRPTAVPDDDLAFEALLKLRNIEWPDAPKPLEVPFTADAADLIQDWRVTVARMEEEAGGMFLSWIGKLPGFAVRLATILQHLKWCAPGRQGPPPAEIEADLVRRAMTLLNEYFCPMALRVFGEARIPESERDARALARWIIRQKPIPEILNARDLRRMKGTLGLTGVRRIPRKSQATQ